MDILQTKGKWSLLSDSRTITRTLEFNPEIGGKIILEILTERD